MPELSVPALSARYGFLEAGDPALDPASILYGITWQQGLADGLTPSGLLDELADQGDDRGISFTTGCMILDWTLTDEALKAGSRDVGIYRLPALLDELRAGDEYSPLGPEPFLIALDSWLWQAANTGSYKEALRYHGWLNILQALLTLRDCCVWSIRSVGAPWVRYLQALPDDYELASLVLSDNSLIQDCRTAIERCREYHAIEAEQGRAI